ncbi:hypothetical protein [Nostoc sp. DedQUE09]|nr:hypothetical protein [Nostoc sp. DedQUE09]MDZ7950509.1 hypothetical protein [Nostoc sp. DedQUE09]
MTVRVAPKAMPQLRYARYLAQIEQNDSPDADSLILTTSAQEYLP